ncbi:MAG: response regulator [Rhizobacter sp.]|nr:response regulator [Rhizobacter sp.]
MRPRQLRELAAELLAAERERDVLRIGGDALAMAFAGPVFLVWARAGDIDPGARVPEEIARGLRCCVIEEAVLGPGTGRWPGLSAWYVPLGPRGNVVGAASIAPAVGADVEGREHAEAIAALVAQASARLRLAEANLATQAALQRQHLQSTFLASVSRDLRTPLTAIVAAASSLQQQRPRLPVAEQDRLLAAIVAEASHLSAVTENTLQLVRLAAGGEAMRFEWQSIEEIVGSVVARLRARPGGERIGVRLAPGLPLVRGDATLLGQLVGNLLDNALKFSEGPVRLVACRASERLLVSVKDRGGGIRDRDAARVFEPFFRGGQAGATRRRRARPRALQGDCRRAPSVARRQRAAARRRSLHARAVGRAAAGGGQRRMSLAVLVVEDDRDIRDVLRASLAAEGFDVLTAVSLSEATALLDHARVDVVVLDLGLPEGDGAELMRRIRRTSALPVVIASARHQESEKIALLDAGADDFLTKPFAVGELLARIRVAMRHRGTALQPAVTRYDSGGLMIDLDGHRVERDGEVLHLTPTELNLAACLVRADGRVVTHRQLLVDVWGAEHVDDVHYLRLYMAQLRAKLEQVPSEPRYLLTETGVAYRLAAE